MPPPSTMCAACLRTARTATSQSERFHRLTPTAAHRTLSTAPPATSTPYLSLLAASQRLSSFPLPTCLQQRRAFTSTPLARRVLLNPRHDDSGAPMEVSITPRAATRLAQIAAKEQNPDLVLRVSVESGGCHGFQYLMSLTDMSKVSQEEDTVFESEYVPKDKGGEGKEGSGAKVVLDEPSLELLKGSKVDYTMELIGSQFKIVDNPAATSSCGCGTSFDIKA